MSTFLVLDIFSKYISQAANPADSLLDLNSSPNASFLNTIKQSIEKFYLEIVTSLQSASHEAIPVKPQKGAKKH